MNCPERAFVACVWFDARVRPHVPCESTLMNCPERAFVACVWFLSCVCPHVVCETALLSCPVLTHGACVWFLSCVRPHVPCESTLGSCPERASRTFVPFARNLGFCKNKLPDTHYRNGVLVYRCIFSIYMPLAPRSPFLFVRHFYGHLCVGWTIQ